MSVLQVAVAGCGGRARRSHLPYLSALKDVKVVALCDPNPTALLDTGEEFRVSRMFPSIDELLDAEASRLDAVFVASPAHINAQVALPCLERGVNTLIDKPPGMSVEETIELRNAAEKSREHENTLPAQRVACW